MTYQEAEWIVKEIQTLKRYWENNLFREYNEIMPPQVYISDIKRMDLDAVKEIIDNHYGVYTEGDIVIEKSGIPALITYIEKDDAETIHDIKYHVIYSYGGTKIINIDSIISKCDNTDEFQKVAEVLNSHY